MPSPIYLIMVSQFYTMQRYAAYTQENLLTWSKLFKNLEEVHSKLACTSYLRNKKKLGLRAEVIPNFAEVNRTLSKYNDGWEIVAVNGILESDTFLYLISEKKFPVTPWIRPMANAYSYDDADMLHDMVGHVPFLLDQRFTNFIHQLAKMAVDSDFDEKVLEIVNRVYWRTIEAGLVIENGVPKVYGAALLSSLGESVRSVNPNIPKIPFSLEECVSRSFFYDREQDEYFLIKSFDQFPTIINQLREQLPLSQINHY